METEDALKQRYSIKSHPTLPLLMCSDGYLVCIMRIQSSFATQSRLIREFMHETIGILNSVSQKLDNGSVYLNDENLFKKKDGSSNERNISLVKRRVSFNSSMDDDIELPEWDIQTTLKSEKSSASDSGLDSNDAKNKKLNNFSQNKNKSESNKIAEGKIIFSFLPQIEPLSHETIKTSSIASRMESAFEYLQSTWTLLVSMPTQKASLDTFECDQTAKAIQRAFAHFSHLLFLLESNDLKELQIYRNEFENIYGSKLSPEIFSNPSEKAKVESKFEDEFKLKVLVDLFVKMLNLLNFDPASKYDPSSHMIIYLPGFIEKYIQSLVKFDKHFSNESIDRMNLFGLVFTLLNSCERLIKNIYRFSQNELFHLNTDPIFAQKSEIKNHDDEEDENSSPRYLANRTSHEQVSFTDILLEKSWHNLLHYSFKFRKTLESLGTLRDKQLTELDMLIILIERRIQQFPTNSLNIIIESQKKLIPKLQTINERQKSKINKADFIYLDLGDVEAAIDLWLAQLNFLFDQFNNKSRVKEPFSLSCLIKKSVVLIHKIFYACVANFKLEKFLDIMTDYFEKNQDYFSNFYSPFNLLDSTDSLFKSLEPPKPLPKEQLALVIVLKSLARFMAIYLFNIDESISINSINNPVPMKTLKQELKMNNSKLKHSKIEIMKSKLISTISKSNILSSFFTVDKTVELFLCLGLFDEALYFLNLINDWKSSFLLSSILKESKNNDQLNNNKENEINKNNSLLNKVVELLGVDKNDDSILEKDQQESVTSILNELLVCSVLTKSNIIEPLLQKLLELFVLNLDILCEKSGIMVPEEFYLPAPPIYCAQMLNIDEYGESDAEKEEANLRLRLCIICKSILVLIISSNLNTPLIKWYLEQLNEASEQMSTKFAIENYFKLSSSLINLLKSVRYQKLGYIPECLFHLFRDFCALLFFLDTRDRFSLSLRQYKKQFSINQEMTASLLQLGLKIIDYGNLLLSYRSFLKLKHFEIQDLILSVISRLTKFNLSEGLNLEQRLAVCVEKQPINLLDNPVFSSKISAVSFTEYIQSNTELFESKVKELLNSWKEIPYDYNNQVSLSDYYEKHVLVNQRTTNAKLRTVYGLGEDVLSRLYMQKNERTRPSICGSYDFERCWWLDDFLEFFFRLGIDRTENWSFLSQSVNKTPLLPQFYEQIRNYELPQNYESTIDKQYLIKSGHNKNKSIDSDAEYFSQFLSRNSKSTLNKPHKKSTLKKDDSLITILNRVNTKRRQGLFRSYSARKLSSTLMNSQNESILFGDNNNSKLYSSLNANKKSVSFNNLNMPKEPDLGSLFGEKIINCNNNDRTRDEDLYSVLDFGPRYISTTNLAIWLIKWAERFNKILITNNKTASVFMGGKNNFKNQVLLRMKHLNANTLVSSVFLSDGNLLSHNLATDSKLQRKKSDEDEEDFTEVTYHNKNNKKRNKSENNSTSSSLNISSLTENQINNILQPKKDPSVKPVPSPRANLNSSLKNQSLLLQLPTIKTNKDEEVGSNSKSDENTSLSTTTVDPFEFYKINENINNNNNNCDDISYRENKSYPQDLLQTQSFGDTLLNIAAKRDEPSLNLSANEFNNKLPLLVPPPNQFESISQNISYHNQQNSNYLPQIQNNNFQRVTPQFNVPPGGFDIHSIIRDELKKIVQIQHDTVMNFLNQGAPNQIAYPPTQPQIPIIQNPSSGLTNNLDQQLISVLKSQNLNQINAAQPLEFVIETKIKTINPLKCEFIENSANMNQRIKSNQVHSVKQEETSYFMQSFDYNNRETVSNPSDSTKTKSRFIQIPLLKTREDNGFKKQEIIRKSEPKVCEPNFQLLSFKKSQISSACKKTSQVDTRINLLHLETDSSGHQKTEINKHVKNFIDLNVNYSKNKKKFQLLTLNSTEIIVEDRKEKSTEETVKKYEVHVEANKESKKEESVDIKSKDKSISKEAQVQVDRPLYDGFILAPGLFDELLKINKENEQLSGSSALAHFVSTQYIRDRQELDMKKTTRNKKDAFTATDSDPGANPISPDILFKLKFDSNREKKDKNDPDSKRDFVNVADLDSHDVDDILKLIEYEQNKREAAAKNEKTITLTKDVMNITSSILLNDTKFNETALTEKSDIQKENESDEKQPVKDNLTDKITLRLHKNRRRLERV
jgi:hypothetical protein